MVVQKLFIWLDFYFSKLQVLVLLQYCICSNNCSTLSEVACMNVASFLCERAISGYFNPDSIPLAYTFSIVIDLRHIPSFGENSNFPSSHSKSSSSSS
mmetsp:Transcript_15691/g.20886  ORF Transcript_15691/g.20886 Transcript_15691/m.20886 type:complete len:98 (+) Transcript_15691:256-549(+)